jgi:hypothetical protein
VGTGAHGLREFHWARVPVRATTRRPGCGHWLLARRSLHDPADIAYDACYGPRRSSTADPAWIAGSRWHNEAGLRLMDGLDGDQQLASQHRLPAVRGHLPEMAGDRDATRAAYLAAARRTTSLPEKRYLERKAATFTGPERAGLPDAGAGGAHADHVRVVAG